MITHEEIRDIAKDNLHWGVRKSVLDYVSQQEKKDELLVLYDKFMYHVLGGAMIVAYRVQEKILKLKAEIEEMK